MTENSIQTEGSLSMHGSSNIFFVFFLLHSKIYLGLKWLFHCRLIQSMHHG